jgi:hypothetical protein
LGTARDDGVRFHRFLHLFQDELTLFLRHPVLLHLAEQALGLLLIDLPVCLRGIDHGPDGQRGDVLNPLLFLVVHGLTQTRDQRSGIVDVEIRPASDGCGDTRLVGVRHHPFCGLQCLGGKGAEDGHGAGARRCPSRHRLAGGAAENRAAEILEHIHGEAAATRPVRRHPASGRRPWSACRKDRRSIDDRLPTLAGVIGIDGLGDAAVSSPRSA